MRIVYDDLVRAYLESLHSKLRNFVVEPEFLATWVHDEDDHVSLFELFAAAQSAGSRQLTVAIGAATARLLDEARLTALLGALGSARISKTSAGLEIDMALAERVAPRPITAPASKPVRPQASSPAPAPRERSAAYHVALAAASASPRHEGPAPTGGLV